VYSIARNLQRTDPVRVVGQQAAHVGMFTRVLAALLLVVASARAWAPDAPLASDYDLWMERWRVSAPEGVSNYEEGGVPSFVIALPHNYGRYEDVPNRARFRVARDNAALWMQFTETMSTAPTRALGAQQYASELCRGAARALHDHPGMFFECAGEGRRVALVEHSDGLMLAIEILYEPGMQSLADRIVASLVPLADGGLDCPAPCLAFSEMLVLRSSRPLLRFTLQGIERLIFVVQERAPLGDAASRMLLFDLTVWSPSRAELPWQADFVGARVIGRERRASKRHRERGVSFELVSRSGRQSGYSISITASDRAGLDRMTHVLESAQPGPALAGCVIKPIWFEPPPSLLQSVWLWSIAACAVVIVSVLALFFWRRRRNNTH
jgi:hypothetical protein